MNGLFSRTTWVSQHQKGKPFWILMKQEQQEMMRHQLDHMHITSTSLQTDNNARTSTLNFLQAECSSQYPTNIVKAQTATVSLQNITKSIYNYLSILADRQTQTSTITLQCMQTSVQLNHRVPTFLPHALFSSYARMSIPLQDCPTQKMHSE